MRPTPQLNTIDYMAHGNSFSSSLRTPDLRMTRLSVEDLDHIAVGLRRQCVRGDLNAGLVADALESVVRRRHAAQMGRRHAHANNFMSSAWQRVTAWASLR